MSRLNVNQISPVSGINTVTIVGVASVTGGVIFGSNIQVGTGGTIGSVSGIVTYFGDGSQLTGIDATKIETGNTKVETIDTGSDGHVKVTTEGSERLTITSAGLVGINHTTSGASTNAPLTIQNSTGSSATRFNLVNSGSSAVESTQIYSQNNDLAFVAGASERLRITSEGYVTGNVNVPCWFGSQDTQHNITTGTWTSLLNLGNSVINPTLNNGGWNESTGTFTAQTGQAGYYYCYGCAGIDDVQDSDIVYCGISKNGANPIFYTENRALDQSANIILGGVMVAQVIELAVGDTAQLRVYHNEGSTEPTEPNRCFFGGYRLSI